ncbi:mCG147046 [Mus musculus]|nr:mCG147046 [Mus musculus]
MTALWFSSSTGHVCVRVSSTYYTHIKNTQELQLSVSNGLQELTHCLSEFPSACC